MENKISAILVVHNEEKVIERCLKSLYNFTDEIIIIHDGPCTDRTVEIAKKYTDKITVTTEQKGISDSWFVMGYNSCQNNWILRMDADEYLSEELRQNIKELVNCNTCDAYSFFWPMWDGTKYISMKASRKTFLFRKTSIGFMDKFHFPAKVIGKLCESDYIVHHKPNYNNWIPETFEKKHKKWAKLHAQDHFADIEKRQIINLSVDELKKEQQIKNIFYQFPISVLILSYILQIKYLFLHPSLVFDKGYWIITKTISNYSYEVAKEARLILNKQTRL